MKKEETVDYHVKVAWHGISRMYNQGGVPDGITASTGFVLLNIDSEEGTPATKIAPLLGMESRSLTRMLKSMEQTGLIIKEQDPQDKRSVRILLTEEGRRKRDLSRKAVIFFNEKISEKISNKEMNGFFKVMSAIDQVIEDTKNIDSKNINGK